MFWIALGVFFGSLILFTLDWIDKTVVALLGAALLIVTGVLTWHDAILAIDYETIALLLGLMIFVGIAQHSGIFDWLNTQIAEKSKGSPLAVFLLLLSFTALLSTVLNNTTVVLLIVPVAIALSQGLGLNTKLIVIGIAMFSNIGGTLTLIGDPPNTLIGVKVGLSFMQFVQNLIIPVSVMSILITGMLILANKTDLKPIKTNFSKVFLSGLIIKRIQYQFSQKPLKAFVVICVVTMLLLSIVAFILQPLLQLNVGLIGLLVGLLTALILFKHIPFQQALKEVEWDSLLFFSALFIQVAALQKVGFLEIITDYIAGFSGNIATLILMIVWGVGLASTAINNIPFVALMIPVITDLQEKMTGQEHLDLLWWALALGACLGGNGTIIGSSSGVLAVDMARKHGVKISFKEYAKIGMPVTIVSLAISSIYLLAQL